MFFRILSLTETKRGAVNEYYVVQKKTWCGWMYMGSGDWQGIHENYLGGEFSFSIKDADKFEKHLLENQYEEEQKEFKSKGKTKLDYLKYLCEKYAIARRKTEYSVTVVEEFEVKK